MYFTVDKETLLRALSRIQGVAKPSSLSRVAGQALIKTQDGTLIISATDLQNHIRGKYTEGISVKEQGSALVNAKILLDIVRSMPNREITIQKKENNNNLEISSGKKVKFKITSQDPNDFPLFTEPDGNILTIPPEKLLQLIDLTSFAMSNDETSPHIYGALLENMGNGITRMVTTDGYRLAIADEAFSTDTILNSPILIPNKGITEIQKLLREKRKEHIMYLACSTNLLYVSIAEIDMNIALQQKKFPDYKAVFPTTDFEKVEIKLDIIHTPPALKRMLVFSAAGDRPVIVSCKNNEAEISVTDSDGNVAKETLQVSVSPQKDVTFAVNGKYILDILNAINDDAIATVSLTDKYKPIIIRPEKQNTMTYVVMPMVAEM